MRTWLIVRLGVTKNLCDSRFEKLFQNQAPEQRFAAQLDQLNAMGFVNREANIQGMSKHL